MTKSRMIRVDGELVRVMDEIKKDFPGQSRTQISKKVAKMIKRTMRKKTKLRGWEFKI